MRNRGNETSHYPETTKFRFWVRGSYFNYNYSTTMQSYGDAKVLERICKIRELNSLHREF